MRAILQVLSGFNAGRKIWIRAGQFAEIGRADGVALSIPQDPAMSRIHFTLECDYKNCRIRDQNSSHGTFVNGDQVEEAIVRDGDKITAGETTFLLKIEGAPKDDEADKPKRKLAKVPADLADEVCELYEVTGAAQEHLAGQPDPWTYYERLMEHGLHQDAVQFLAFALPLQESAWWALQCVQSVQEIAPAWQPTREALLAWIRDPTDENRAEVRNKSEAGGVSNSVGLIGMAAFMSGNIGHEDFEPVAAPPGVASGMIYSSLCLAALDGDPTQAATRHETFAPLGLEVAKGTNTWETK